MVTDSSTSSWGSDVPVSMPQPIPADQIDDLNMPMYGFRFSPRGLQHDLTTSDIEAILAERYLPRTHNEQRDDADVDDL